MQIKNVNGDVIDMMLNQLGAKEIRNFSSTMHIASFDLGDGLEVAYVFNITHGDKYFLQRMKPYAMVHGKYASYSEIIEFITNDVKKFRKAKEVNDIGIFLDLAAEMDRIRERTEHIFLNHDVSIDDFKVIMKGFDDALEKVERANKKSELIRKKAEQE